MKRFLKTIMGRPFDMEDLKKCRDQFYDELKEKNVCDLEDEKFLAEEERKSLQNRKIIDPLPLVFSVIGSIISFVAVMITLIFTFPQYSDAFSCTTVIFCSVYILVLGAFLLCRGCSNCICKKRLPELSLKLKIINKLLQENSKR